MAEIYDIYKEYRLSIWAAFLVLSFGILTWIRRDHRLDRMPGPRGWPLIGIGISLPPRAPERFRQWGAKYGEIFKLRVGYHNWVVINSPQAFREILDQQVCIDLVSQRTRNCLIDLSHL